MIELTREARASYAFVERNFNLTKRYLGWEVAFLVYAVAGALSVSLIGESVGSQRLLMQLVVGAVFWNYLSVVFNSIGDTISWERWEGTLEYTMMAPVRRSTQLLGSALYAVIYGLIHTTILLIVLALFFSLDLGRADLGAAALFMTVGSASFVGIGMLAAILPMMSVERGSQMVFVLQSCLLLVSGVYYPTTILPGWKEARVGASPDGVIAPGRACGAGAPRGIPAGDRRMAGGVGAGLVARFRGLAQRPAVGRLRGCEDRPGLGP